MKIYISSLLSILILFLHSVQSSPPTPRRSERLRNKKQPIVTHYRDGTAAVDRIHGKFFDNWFLPFDLPNIKPEDAPMMRIRILTEASFQAGPILIQNGDELLRTVSNGFQRTIQVIARARGRKFNSVLHTDQKGKPLVVNPEKFDVLLRNNELFGQYHVNGQNHPSGWYQYL